ncbi:hypothetical protein EYR38_003229 [Pleurotus pulmonarius]|nr:hypothetical protein EYR38_003229 [Pleurotus pulmonarius]
MIDNATNLSSATVSPPMRTEPTLTNSALNVGLISIHHTSAEIFGGLQLAASVVCDVLITGSLVWYLRRGRGVFKQTQSLVDRLVIYSINIGLVTSMLSLVAMITWFAMPDNFIFTTFHILIGKVYVNSLLVTLNTRKTIRSTGKSNKFKFEVNSSGGISDGTGAFFCAFAWDCRLLLSGFVPIAIQF